MRYAHLQPGSVIVKVGDKVKTGAPLGKLGNSGNSTAPHLHFGLLDRPNALLGESLPFAIDNFQLTNLLRVIEQRGQLVEDPKSRAVSNAYPLVSGVATFQ